MKRLLPISLLLAALCISTAAFAQKDKVVEASSKRKPAWIGSSDRSHFAVTEVGETLAAASGKCMASIRQYIVNAVAVNVSSAEKMATRQITRDHSYVEDLVEHGELTEAEARIHPQKNMLTRAVGVEESLEVDSGCFDVSEGDVLLLATDGLMNMVSEEEIVAILQQGEADPARALVESALRSGGRDNVTAVVVVYAV